MILDYYRIFYYVAQYKSFSKAAEVMGNNQPNITRCMNILENELGCKLFIRSNRGVQLTVEGERLHNHVSIAMEQLVARENELLKEKGLESGLVNIGASETALRLILLTELESFHHQSPHVKLLHLQPLHATGNTGFGKWSGGFCSDHHTYCIEKAPAENPPLFFPRDSAGRTGICRYSLHSSSPGRSPGYPSGGNRFRYQHS